MNINIKLLVTVLSLLLIAVDLFFAARAYRKHTVPGRYLGRLGSLAALIAFSYLISILATDYVGASVMASIYFASIDWMLITMIRFATVVSTGEPMSEDRFLMKALKGYAAFDSLVFAVNPIAEIAIHYVPRNTRIAYFAYEMMPLYYAHLAFTYLMVVAVIGILARKCIRTPRQYRGQYAALIMAVIVVVLINAVFLIPADSHTFLDLIDASIPGYSIGILIMYWSVFQYNSIHLKLELSDLMFDNLDRGVAFFDYDGRLVYKNRIINELFPDLKDKERIFTAEFAERCGIGVREHRIGDNYTIQCMAQRGDKSSQLRCDYTRLRNESGKVIGSMFVLTDASEEIDALTGYHIWTRFDEYIYENPDVFKHPFAVAVFDICGLSAINTEQGKDAGDQYIRELSAIIRSEMPEETYYIRGYDAHLIAIAYYRTETEMRMIGERIVELSPLRLSVGYSTTDSYDPDVVSLIKEASRSMTIKKLLDGKSAHSHSLTSLVRALRESDSDTEAHVRRTQNMGRVLGERIGLTDLQQSQLQLLCLLHDIGKVGIPLEILNKPGKLTDEEWNVLRTHAEKGYEIARSSEEFRDIADMILYHHERWDGKGYPSGRMEAEIPLLSRIISVVDTYDAMVNDRSYRKAVSAESAKMEILQCSGSQFDPDLANEFLLMLEDRPELARGEVVSEPEKVNRNWRRYTAAEREGSIVRTRGAEEAALKQGPPAIMSHPVSFSRYIMNLDDYIMHADDDFTRMTGYTGDDIKEMNLRQLDLIPEEDREKYFEAVERQLMSGDMVFMEHRLKRKDGQTIYVFCFAKRYYDSAAKVVRTEVVIFDSASTHAYAGTL